MANRDKRVRVFIVHTLWLCGPAVRIYALQQAGSRGGVNIILITNNNKTQLFIELYVQTTNIRLSECLCYIIGKPVSAIVHAQVRN
jgi:hypothetical protein